MRIIGGKYRGRQLILPPEKTTRPTADLVKTSLFNILAPIIEDTIILDLFAGSGSLGLEALSRGCRKAVFVEKNKLCFEVLKKNCAFVSGEKELYNKSFEDALAQLSKLEQKFDIVFLDPPYQTDFCLESINLLLKYKLLYNEAIIVIERDATLPIKLEFEPLVLYAEKKYGRKKLYFIKFKEKE